MCARGGILGGPVEGLEARQVLTVTYHGGALLKNVEVQGVYLGSDWGTNADLQARAAAFEQFLPIIVGGSYMDMLTNAGYYVGRGSATPGIFDSLELEDNATLTDAGIRTRIQTLITAGSVSAPDANQLYVVFVEPGVLVQNGIRSSDKSFLGYHGAFQGTTATGKKTDVRYAIIVTPGGPNLTSASQGYASDFDQMTSVTSHEIAESATDPDVNYKKRGWYDQQRGYEIADLARRQTDFLGYRVYNVVDQQGNVLDPNGQSSGPDAPPTVCAPLGVTVSRPSTASLEIRWEQVANATDYRVYVINGTKAKQVAKVNSDVTTYLVTGAKAKKGTGVLIQAVNQTSFDDSRWTGAGGG